MRECEFGRERKREREIAEGEVGKRGRIRKSRYKITGIIFPLLKLQIADCLCSHFPPRQMMCISTAFERRRALR